MDVGKLLNGRIKSKIDKIVTDNEKKKRDVTTVKKYSCDHRFLRAKIEIDKKLERRQR